MRALIKFLVLLAVAIGLAVYHWGVMVPEGEEQERTERVSRRVFPLGDEEELATLRDSAAEIRLTPEGATDEIILERGDEDWRITAPRALDADQSAVSSLVSTLTNLQLAGSPDESVIGVVPDERLEVFGLNPPGARVALRYEGETALRRVALGEKDPSDRDRYALDLDTGEVLVVQDRETAINRTLFDLRDRRLLRFESDEVRSVTHVEASGEIALRAERDAADADWRMTAPLAASTEASQITSVLSQLRNARIAEYIDESATPDAIAASGLASPEHTVTLSLATDYGDITQRLLIGPEDGSRRVALLEGTAAIVAVPSYSLSTLLREPGDLPTRDMETVRIDPLLLGTDQ